MAEPMVTIEQCAKWLHKKQLGAVAQELELSAIKAQLRKTQAQLEDKENQLRSLQPHTPKKDCGRTEDEDCPVCLLSMKAGKAVFKTTCGHSFHFECIKKCLLTGQAGCPLCRNHFR